MRLAEDQHAVEELAPYGADETFADGVHPWSLHGGAQDPGAICLEDSVEVLGELRSAVADHQLDALEAFAEAEGQIAGLVHRPLRSGVRRDAAQVHLAGAVLDEYQDMQPLQQHGIHVKEIDREDPISRLVPDPPGVPPQHRVLMPEHQQLSILGQALAEH